MALRTFRHNPSLGGFGGGGSGITPTSFAAEDDSTSSSVGEGDTFCQIVKELVDNAVDACRVVSAAAPQQQQKQHQQSRVVRINIDPYHVSADDRCPQKKEQLLRVTVTDNGCGMEDIRQCVEAFSTSKGHNQRSDEISNSNTTTTHNFTSGRYGIGLTLCLLHAQRLVPNTQTSIQSATAPQPSWTVMSCVVDTDRDAVRCFPQPSQPKLSPGQSGTSVSLLVPGGPTAVTAWRRLAHFFARFQLSLDLPCRMEVLAPTLARVPLYIRPITEANMNHYVFSYSPAQQQQEEEEEVEWIDPTLHVVTPSSHGRPSRHHSNHVTNRNTLSSSNRLLLAMQQFLQRPVPPDNLAFTRVPIRSSGIPTTAEAPTMDVTLVVYGGASSVDNDEDGNVDTESSLPTVQENKKGDESEKAHQATMQLIRIVNHIPLLDSAEGVACGLVQGIIGKESVWQSVGLDVSLSSTSTPRSGSATRVPTFAVKDSSQVLPFQKSQHTEPYLSNDDDEEESDNESVDQIIAQYQTRRSRKRSGRRVCRRPRNIYLPCDARLGKILLLVHIHAKPSQLPLPTLCKGRIPQDNLAINQALEVGLRSCLRQLQTSNPGLFLTARELRAVERKVCFVPLLSNAVASILSRSNSVNTQRAREVLRSWQKDCAEEEEEEHGSEEITGVSRMSNLLRDRLQMVLAQPKKKARRGSSSTLCDPEVKTDNDNQDDLLPDLLHAFSWDASNNQKQVEKQIPVADQEDDDSFVDML